MGFKKGWKVYKSTHGKSVKRTSSKRSVKRVVTKKTMAKRKSYKKKKPIGTFGNAMKGIGSLAGPIIYGAARAKISNMLSNTTFVQRLPVSDYTDEAVMLGLNKGLRMMKLGSQPLIGSVLRAQKQIELARIGETLAKQLTQGSSNSALPFKEWS